MFFEVLDPSVDLGEEFTVRGIAPDPINHYDLAAIAKRTPGFERVTFDPEQGEFFAYVADRGTAELLRSTLDALVAQQTNPIYIAAVTRHAEIVGVIEVALLNISEAGEFFKGDNPARAKADYIALKLRDKGLV